VYDFFTITIIVTVIHNIALHYWERDKPDVKFE